MYIYKNKYFINFKVPSEIWNLEELMKRRSGTFIPEFDKCPEDDNCQWWSRKSISNLNLSSNVILEISSEIQHLLDLTVLNVRHLLQNKKL